jgi:hypothetical protein
MRGVDTEADTEARALNTIKNDVNIKEMGLRYTDTGVSWESTSGVTWSRAKEIQRTAILA